MDNKERPKLGFEVQNLIITGDTRGNFAETEKISAAVDEAISNASNLMDFVSIIKEKSGYVGLPEVFTPTMGADGYYEFRKNFGGRDLVLTVFGKGEGHLYFYPSNIDLDKVSFPPADGRVAFEVTVTRAE